LIELGWYEVLKVWKSVWGTWIVINPLGVPPCDGIVYEPDSSSYFLYTGAAAASTSKQILYSKKCELTCFVLDINYQSQNTV